MQPEEKWQEGTIQYDGKEYQYNRNIRTYLMMGIDTDDKVAKAKTYNSGGQSDAMFLLVIDSSNQTLKVVSINRNTITNIALCDEKGNDLGEVDAQICLQHAFGDGKRLSCTRSVDAVSNLFDHIPISGYLAMNMGAIPMMNDAIGGVELTVLQNIANEDKDVDLKKGEDVTLSGDEAYCYLRTRELMNMTARQIVCAVRNNISLLILISCIRSQPGILPVLWMCMIPSRTIWSRVWISRI